MATEISTPDRFTDRVELTIPMRAEFMSVARLTVAGVANRAGFDFDAIEDIKVSLSEVCNRIIGSDGNGYAAGTTGAFRPARGAAIANAGGADLPGPAAGNGEESPGSQGSVPECRIEFILSGDGLRINFYACGIDSRIFMNKAEESEAVGSHGADTACDDTAAVAAPVSGEAAAAASVSDEAADDPSKLWLSLIYLLMDEFTVNPGGGCLVSMKKHLW